jgi:hypothetical protein
MGNTDTERPAINFIDWYDRHTMRCYGMVCCWGHEWPHDRTGLLYYDVEVSFLYLDFLFIVELRVGDKINTFILVVEGGDGEVKYFFCCMACVRIDCDTYLLCFLRGVVGLLGMRMRT